jgi:hypothetical protein
MNHTELPADWDNTIAKLGGHFLQTKAWADFQESLGRQVVFDSGSDWAWLGALRQGRGGIRYLYSAYGPVVLNDQGTTSNDPSGSKAALESIVAAGQEQNVDFIRCEPWGDVYLTDLRKAGFSKFGEYQPQHMLELDLTPDLETIRKGASQSNRNLINQAEARGLSFRISDDPKDITSFNQIHNATAEHGGFTNHGDDYYTKLIDVLIKEGVGRLYFADHSGAPVAAALCYDWNGTRYYAFAGADPVKNRDLKAAVALLWWLIADAKEQGLVRFNYGGIAPDDQPDHPWAGHTRFKRSIGGESIQTLGTWEKPLKTAKYGLYKLAKRVLPL